MKNDQPPKPFTGSVKDIEQEIKKRRLGNENKEEMEPIEVEKYPENKTPLCTILGNKY